MILTKDYLEGLLCERELLVRCVSDRVGSEFYSYMFTPMTEYAEKATRVLVHNAKFNWEGSGIPKEYLYVLTISDGDCTNMRYVGANHMRCEHFKYIGDNMIIAVDFDTWKKEGSNA